MVSMPLPVRSRYATSRGDDPERIHPLRGAIDEAVGRERGGCDEEEMLALDRSRQFRRDAVEGLSHMHSIV